MSPCICVGGRSVGSVVHTKGQYSSKGKGKDRLEEQSERRSVCEEDRQIAGDRKVEISLG